jgi:pimeloyl-ACP methyl ester carboxylesterase
MIVRDGGPPRLTSPLGDGPPPADRAALPLMIYLPGIDGTGLAAARQFPSLLRRFDLCTLITPPEDRTGFQGLVDLVAAFLQAEVPRHPPTRPVYVLGESFGGVLALAVAAACPTLVDRMVLVNPATSFADSPWASLGPLLPVVPAELYRGLPLALAPVLGNPVNLLAAALDGAEPGAGAGEVAALVARGAAQLLSQLPLLSELLPPQTLAFKLDLLRDGCAAVAPLLGRVPQRVLLLVGDADLLIPSAQEGPRLARALPRAHLRVERGRSHALLQEGGVDLVAIMEEEGCLVRARRMSAPVARRGGAAAVGPAAPIELPTPVELARYAGRTTQLGRRLTSPVFLSTSADGVEALGLGNVPPPGQGPVLYVGNHQTLALDLGVLCEQFLAERDTMLRGLAHPVIFADGQRAAEDKDAAAAAAERGGGGGAPSGGLSPFDLIPAMGEFFAGGGGGGGGPPAGASDGRSSFAAFMTEFGAVPVSARNLMRLLQNGESVLLFPGGVREAYKRKGEDYQLFWPQRSEFVRMAARHGATIVPFAAVGVDDALEILLDSDELARAPVLGPMVTARANALPRARRGVAAGGGAGEEESFVSPLAVPRLTPRRMYFQFQRPIVTSPADLEDRARCDEIYREVRASVEGGLAGLRERREGDPFRDFGARMLYEAARGGKQAPTFPTM